MTQIEILKQQQENIGLKIEVLILRSRVNEMAADVLKQSYAELGGAIKSLQGKEAAETAPQEVPQAIEAVPTAPE